MISGPYLPDGPELLELQPFQRNSEIFRVISLEASSDSNQTYKKQEDKERIDSELFVLLLLLCSTRVSADVQGEYAVHIHIFSGMIAVQASQDRLAKESQRRTLPQMGK